MYRFGKGNKTEIAQVLSAKYLMKYKLEVSYGVKIKKKLLRKQACLKRIDKILNNNKKNRENNTRQWKAMQI